MSEWIFFDLDGTLVDSLPALYRAYLDFLEEFGCKGSEEEFQKFNGPPLREIVVQLKEIHGLGKDTQELLKIYREKVEKRYSEEVQPFSDAGEVLSFLKGAGKNLALVTSASQALAMPVINRLEWASFFTHTFFGDLKIKGKPSPEIYHHALKEVAITPEKCFVVEDSPKGVLAAKGAGLRVYAISRDGVSDELKNSAPDEIIYSLNELCNE